MYLRGGSNLLCTVGLPHIVDLVDRRIAETKPWSHDVMARPPRATTGLLALSIGIITATPLFKISPVESIQLPGF